MYLDKTYSIIHNFIDDFNELIILISKDLKTLFYKLFLFILLWITIIVIIVSFASFFVNTLRNISSARYIIFCGAPRHLTGVAGNVKKASPPLNFCKALNVSLTVFTE